MRKVDSDILRAARLISRDLAPFTARPTKALEIVGPKRSAIERFREYVADPELRASTEQLFMDGHYARAVEEGFKCLNNYIKRRIGSNADGSGLMKSAFSAKSPMLKFNRLKSQSEQDEQLGYMEIFSGSMTGIRNPRAHEHRIRDSLEEALSLLKIADHLFLKARAATRTRATRTS